MYHLKTFKNVKIIHLDFFFWNVFSRIFNAENEMYREYEKTVVM